MRWHQLFFDQTLIPDNHHTTTIQLSLWNSGPCSVIDFGYYGRYQIYKTPCHDAKSWNNFWVPRESSHTRAFAYFIIQSKCRDQPLVWCLRCVDEQQRSRALWSRSDVVLCGQSRYPSLFFRHYDKACDFQNQLNSWEMHNKELVHLDCVNLSPKTLTQVHLPSDFQRFRLLDDYDHSTLESPPLHVPILIC